VTRIDAARDQLVMTSMDVEALVGRVRGPVFLPNQPGYDEERMGFERSVTHHPVVAVGATGPDDVVAAVEFATSRGLGVGVQATGHGAPASVDGGVLITTRRMTGLRVDPSARTARFEAGVTWEQVSKETAPYGLAPLSGSAPFVGAVSYTLGGGLGLLGRRYGYAADHVRRLDLVTADGRLLRATAEEHPDLFWALRGDKGNLGVVTAMEVELMPVSRLYGGGLFFSGEATRDVLHAYREWTKGVPDEMSSSVALIAMPDFPAVPEPLRGRFITHVRIAYLGTPAEGDRLIQPLRDAGPRLVDAIEEMPYTAAGTIHNDPRTPAATYGTGAMLREFDQAAVESLVELRPESFQGPYFFVELRHLGGALGRPPEVSNAVGHRAAAFTFYILSFHVQDQIETIAGSQQTLLSRMSPWAIGGELLNFINGDNTTLDRVRAAYDPDTYARLADLKATYDPRNTFRFNHNIPPAP
jgi:FAD/FMN-containing dehydrogenase